MLNRLQHLLPISTLKAASGIIVLLLLFRFVELEKDPPLFYAGHTQAHITDPYHLTFAARNEILFDDPTPFGFDRWDVFKNSLISGVSYLLFTINGVSRTTANIAAIILQIGGFLFFLSGFLGRRPRQEIILTALLIFVNATLFFYGRIPFLENGLIFLSGLTFFIFMKYNQHWWGQFLAGVLVALAALSGKLFGLLLIAPVIVTLFFIYRSSSILPIVLALSGLATGLLLQLFLFYQGDPFIMINYYTEHTVGMYGTPPGLRSPLKFLMMTLTYGSNSALWKFNPFLLSLGTISLALIAITVPLKKLINKENLPLLFCMIWLIVSVGGLMPFQYRPMRYSLFFFMPLISICAYMIWHVIKTNSNFVIHRRFLGIPFLLLLFWYGTNQFKVFADFIRRDDVLFSGAVVSSLIVSLLIFAFALSLTIGLYKRKQKIPQGMITIVIFALGLGYFLQQSLFLYQGIAYSPTNLREINAELEMIIGNNSVLTGPYTPAFTIDNKIKGVIYMFGLSIVEKDLFERFPITHVLADSPNWNLAVKQFPFLKDAARICLIVIRKTPIWLYRLPDATSKITDFERASIYRGLNQADSAYYYIQKFCDENPKSYLGKMHLAIELILMEEIEQSVNVLESLSHDFSHSFLIHQYCVSQYERIYEITGEKKYLDKSLYHEQENVRLNPLTPR